MEVFCSPVSAVPAADPAKNPTAVFEVPVVIFLPQSFPTKVLVAPAPCILYPAFIPTAVFESPVILLPVVLISASFPIAVLPVPVDIYKPALAPIIVLPVPVVIPKAAL